MRLDIGAGNRPYEDGKGWTHNDARALPDIEIVCDIRELPSHVADGSCEAILARHVLEHFPHHQTPGVLREWLVMLQPGGRILIEVPNLEWQCRAILDASSLGPEQMTERPVEWTQDKVVVLMYGDQDYPGNAHLTGFTANTLMHSLLSSGFVKVNVMDVGMVLVANAEAPDA